MKKEIKCEYTEGSSDEVKVKIYSDEEIEARAKELKYPLDDFKKLLEEDEDDMVHFYMEALEFAHKDDYRKQSEIVRHHELTNCFFKKQDWEEIKTQCGDCKEIMEVDTIEFEHPYNFYVIRCPKCGLSRRNPLHIDDIECEAEDEEYLDELMQVCKTELTPKVNEEVEDERVIKGVNSLTDFIKYMQETFKDIDVSEVEEHRYLLTVNGEEICTLFSSSKHKYFDILYKGKEEISGANHPNDIWWHSVEIENKVDKIKEASN